MNLISERTTFRLIVAALVLGTAYRLFPIVTGMPTLRQLFITEDGYLMLIIARNMAIGLGMSVSDGTIHSNGVQPLATFIFALPYLLTGGDKVAGLVGLHLIMAAISVAGIFSVRALARLMLRGQDPAPLWPWFVAALWYLGPLLLFHSMNGLETGLYTVVLTLTLLIFGRLLVLGDAAGVGARMILGAACGIAFLARNDGVFLVTAIFAVWALDCLLTRRRSFSAMLAELVPPGLLSLVIAAPWLIHNQVNFGSIVPVSGRSEALTGGFAKNADLLPAALFEHAFPMLPVPAAMQMQPLFVVPALTVTGAVVLAFLVGAWRRGGPTARVIAAYGLFALAMVAYYGFSFGAGWFLSRYLAPLAPLLITATVSVLIGLVQWLTPALSNSLLRLLGLAGIALSVALLGRALVPGARDQGHFQVVDWVTQNVPEETWVGAVQTGTLGYWHDRTINLDGKVNPEALRALLEEGNTLDYILKSSIDYLADWSGIAAWDSTGNLGNTAFSDAFEVIVEDEASNLAVLRRVR